MLSKRERDSKKVCVCVGQQNSYAEITRHLHNVHCAHVHIILGMKNKIHGSGASDIIKLIILINILMTAGLVGWVAQCSHR